MPTPEERARQTIDRLLNEAGWSVQPRERINLGASLGVAVTEFPLQTGFADYLLFVNRQAVGVIEAKPAGTTLSGVAEQSAAYLTGLPASIPHIQLPLPFAYESTGVETFFRDERDPEPRSRRVFAFHQPETLAEWAAGDWTLRARLRDMPPLVTKGLWGAQVEAVRNLEKSFAQDHPRALIQMATGSGKTFTAVTFVYRLIKFAGARRILFLVDRNNLGRQALREFQQYVTPDDGRKFAELYNVQRMTSNVLDPVSKVCITTIQRLYSMLSGETEFDATEEERSLWGREHELAVEAGKLVSYNPTLPIEYFDFIITDECHRSIYNLWRQVLEYFDAFIIGLTATPSKQTLGFFNQNLVMEYSRERAVADGVNVDGQVYRIRTEITEQGSYVEAGHYVDKRDRRTRHVRWEQLDEDLEYAPSQLDREVVSKSQIRTVIRAFRDALKDEIYPGRSEVPKTLIFAKDDSHAEDIVGIVREEFGKGNEFCRKITYKVTGAKPEDLIASFRNSYFPRIAVSVDMISTGTDIKPLEVLLFLRPVKSRLLFEQMLGRGTRVISETDLQAVTPDTRRKTHFVIVDAVGVVENPKFDTQTMERKRTVPFDKLLEDVALGVRDDDTLTTLAGRLARLERKLTEGDVEAVAELTGGRSLRDLANSLLDAVDPDALRDAVESDAPTAEELAEVQAHLVQVATAPFDEPGLRQRLIAVHQRAEQIIDVKSVDRILRAEWSDEQARSTVESFERFIEEHKDEIAALQIIYNQPYARQRLTYQQVKELAERLELPPNAWTTDALWRAYAQLERDKVRGVSARRVLTDLVSLVRHAVHDDELEPYPDRVRRRYEDWLGSQEAAGQHFTAEQRWWLDQIAAHIGVNLGVTAGDFGYGSLFQRGGWYAAQRLFGPGLPALLEELIETLAS
ncbi:MAG: type I restriction-modification enzyme R subunit C-terminal domain-containing protein [Anaerolineae bacterium]|jgi:type I restriction enzyme R subunit